MKSVRNTAAKSEIQELIRLSGKALSHLEIQEQLNGLCDRVTIYRVLDRLVLEHAVHRIVNTDGTFKYAFCRDCHGEHRHSHAHFSCENCKAVTCLEGVEPSFQLPENYRVNEVNFTLRGLCPQCVEQAA